MQPVTPQLQDYNRLRAAYADLTEDQKRKFSQTVAKQDSRLFQAWFTWATCNGYTERSAPARPPGVGPKLDHALLKSKSSERLLRATTATFFRTEFPSWIEFIKSKLVGATSETVRPRLADILEMSDAPFVSSPWRELLRGRTLLTPEDWLDSVDSNAGKSVAVESPLENNAAITAAIEPAVEDAVGFEPRDQRSSDDASVAHSASFREEVLELRQRTDSFQKIVDAIKAGKPFDLHAASEALVEIEKVTSRLQSAAAFVIGIENLEQLSWETLKELEALVEKAETDKETLRAITGKRDRLLSVADALKCITRINMKAAAVRARAEELRKSAISELELSARGGSPADLPGQLNGRDWLEEMLCLEQDVFEAWILKLNEKLLSNLGRFLAEVETFERLTFSDSSANITSGEPSEAETIPSVVSSRGQFRETVQARDAVPPATDDLAPESTSSLVVEVTDAALADSQKLDLDSHGAGNTPSPISLKEEAVDIAQSAAPEAELQPDQPVARNSELQPISNPPPDSLGDANGEAPKAKTEAGSERPLVTAVQPEATKTRTGYGDSKNLDSPIAVSEDRQAFVEYAKNGMWAVCSILASRADVGDKIAPGVLEILALLPTVREPAGITAEAIKSRLEAAEAPDDSISASQLVIWSAALIPASILVSFTNAPAILRTLHWPGNLQALHQLAQSAIRLAESVQHISLQLLRGAQPRLVWENQLAEIATEVDLFEREARGQTILYQPATEVWKYLWKHGAFSELARQLKVPRGAGDKRRVKALLEEIAPGRSFHKLIQSIHAKNDSTSKVRIEARAVPQFEGKSEPLRHAASRWLELTENVPQATNFVSDRVSEFKARWAALHTSVVNTVASDPDLDPAAKAALYFALSEFAKLIDPGTPITETESDPHEHLSRELLSIPGLRFDSNRQLVGEVSGQLDALKKYSGCRLSLQQSATERIVNRDVIGAKLTLSLLGRDSNGEAEHLRVSLQQLTAEMRKGIGLRLKELRRQASNARLSGIIGESDASILETAFVVLERKALEDDNLCEVENEIAERSIALAGQTSRGKELLLERIRRSVTDDNDRERLEKLVATEDVMTVHEYLARLSAGEKLPKEDGKNLQPFAGFTSERQTQINAALASAGELDGLKGTIRSGGAFAGVSFRSWSAEARQRDAAWLDIWLKVKTSGRVEQERVEVLLSSLGFVVQSVRQLNRGAVQISEADIETLTERSVCPIPKFGSLAGGSLVVRHLWKWVDEDTLVQAVGETAQQPQLQLIFFYGRLMPDRRLALAKLSRAKRRSFLVLDESLLAHLCCLTEGRLGAFFRAATPFTFADPFVTASSLVPPEMFYGREEELAALMSSDNGRCFVYGGRQLGKTALLREAERRFSKASLNNLAIWIDLLNHGIGREHAPSEIWTTIIREFSRHLGSQRVGGAPRSQDEIARSIESWLDESKDRRVLLLLDEADRFLEEDARDDFREARRLKGIMDRTSRRFKVVFAGLHNVQRTTRQANHPLAHLGDPINVGALSQNREWNAAFALASEPLTALGVRFTSADLVSRVLTICNFYPGLIQQFSARVWRRLLDRRADGPPFQITEAELDDVYRDPELRQDIVGRFKLTLQLDPRYWHLAHIVAFQFLEAPQEAETGYTAAELRKFATDWWQEGFVQGSSDEFRSLLDEMCALGVLKVVGDKYSFRNANILQLLGARSDVESELLSGPRKIIDYTPRSFRARRKREDSYLRRPLTLSEESRLSARQNGVAFIAGSSALGINDVGISLGEIAPSEHFHQVPRTVTNVEQLERDLGYVVNATRNIIDGLFWVWIPAKLKWNEDWVAAASNCCERLRSDKRFIRVVFEASPDYLWSDPARWKKRFNDEPSKVWALRKWTADFMGPWLLELGVPSAPNDVAMVMERTGGWPIISQEAAKRFAQNSDWRKAIDAAKDGVGIPKETATMMFVGDSPHAQDGLKLLSDLRHQQLLGEKIAESDISAYAELLGVPEVKLRETLDIAEMLALIDRTDYNARAWDAIFERHILL